MAFRLETVLHAGRRISLSYCADYDSSESNHCTIIIGKNGTGKSRLLSEICRMFASMESNGRINRSKNKSTDHERFIPEIAKMWYSLDDVGVQLSFFDRKFQECLKNNINVDQINAVPTPRKVIATTITPFDKFPIGQRPLPLTKQGDAKKVMYRYLGSKNNVGQLSSTGQLSRVIESLMFASEKKRCEIVRLNKVFDFLGYHPNITVNYDFRFRKSAIEESDLLTEKVHSGEELLRLAGGDLRRKYAFESELSKNPHFPQEIVNALRAVVGSVEVGRTCTIELDLESGYFRSGSLDIFRDVLFLRKHGLLSLSDLRLTKATSNEKVSIRDASSGEQAIVLTFLGIASEIEDSSLIIIDEPEISLHPEWQEKFVGLLTSTFAEYRGCHFILATHSPLLLSKIDSKGATVVTMDDHIIKGAKELSNKSADYQLAEVFGTPGYRNEYLAREGLSALRLASKRQFNAPEFIEKMALLRRLRPQLDDEDPVAQLADALVKSAEEPLNDSE